MQEAGDIPHKVTDADYADDLALLADTLAQAESMLHSLEEAAKNIGLYVNSDKTGFMSFKIKETSPHSTAILLSQ